MSSDLTRILHRYADRHADAEGIARLPFPGVALMRVFAPTGEMRALYKPLLCLVLQGAKDMMIGAEIHTFHAGDAAIVSADTPVVGRIVQASRTAPYLALVVELDMAALRELIAQTDGGMGAVSSVAGPVLRDTTDDEMRDCATRLVRLVDRPDAIPALHPLIVREMHYWLLAGRHGAVLRRLAHPDSAAQRIARAVTMLRQQFARSIPVEQLAAVAGMSPSSFHQHFRSVTSLSPRQFQKQLRLLEARRLMLADGRTAARAAFEVGYESVPQFTREYGRMFGAPPRRDVGERRTAA